jgi:uncharacterized coiled-coil protein SlyX
MSKDNTLAESISTFGPQSHVQPSEEQIFVLTAGQLQEIITRAIQKAIQPLQDRIEALEATVARQDEKIAALESTEEQDISRLALDIAYDRRRISRLEHPQKEPGKTELSRGEKIEKYLASRPDHRATFETLKGHLQVDNVRLNEAIKILIATGRYSIQKAKTGDKRKRILVMLPR